MHRQTCVLFRLTHEATPLQESSWQTPVVSSGFGLLVFDEMSLLKVTEETVLGESLFVTVMEDNPSLLCVVSEETVVNDSSLLCVVSEETVVNDPLLLCVISEENVGDMPLTDAMLAVRTLGTACTKKRARRVQ